MKIAKLAVIFVLIFSVKGVAQQVGRVSAGVDVGTGIKENAWAPSIMYHQELSLNHFPWFRVGWGVRGSGYYANRSDLAPKNTSMSGDTLKFGKVTTNTISFLIGANIRVWKFDIGANTDLVGLTFGAKRTGLYSQTQLPVEGKGYEFYNMPISSTPTTFSAAPLLLNNQNGQSELYVRFWVTDRVGLKLGYVHGRVAYTAAQKLYNDQTIFSKTYGLPYAAISFPLYN